MPRNRAIDAALISDLVDRFYGRIRLEPLLGPIFEAEIGDEAEWDAHLAKLKSFWRSVMLQEGSYTGRPMPAHMKLKGLTPEHFQRWLGLFRQTLGEIGAGDAATEALMDRAMRIAQSFQLNIFYNPARS
tara:strand:- start:43943 stop:44332 length:390 start_codon:yes stop_codon:yes gene_type:complete